MKANGQINRSQIITTYGPGALIDLPRHSAIVGGLEAWPKPSDLEEILEPRLSAKLEELTQVPSPRLYAPPADTNDPAARRLGISVWRFPEWFVVQEKDAEHRRSRRLVHRRMLDDKGRFDGMPVVATRFLRSCPRGHVDDLDWHSFVHHNKPGCPRTRQLWLDEKGTGGDLADLSVRCECGEKRDLYEATFPEKKVLGFCTGRRPWLGNNTSEECHQPSRLLIRTASNAYFSQAYTVLSLPNRGSELETLVRGMWSDLQYVQSEADMGFVRRKPEIAQALREFSNEQVLAAIETSKLGTVDTRPIKIAELSAILEVPEGYGDDVPVDENFHARRLPATAWRRNSSLSGGIESVIQLHRLREVSALIGFTRFEASSPDVNGEYDTDVERASIAIEPAWFPASENRGEGIFVQLNPDAVSEWLGREGVKDRLRSLAEGHNQWKAVRGSNRSFPSGAYILLHTLSHLLLQSLAMRCGYPASSISERIYADSAEGRFGILLYTGSPDAEGTLGGLVQQGRYIEDHLAEALQAAALCSNDPICSMHEPGHSLEKRYLQGACCHGCALLPETSCEVRNDYLDRALVVPVLGCRDAAFFKLIAR